MAGHNKWSKIKRTKGVLDAKRGKIFTKILREIQVASRIGGGDPKSNPRLRDAIQDARLNNMPKDNIERAIQRGLGNSDGAQYEAITYEAYGPGGAALLIECLSDNRNRTAADVREALSRNGGSLAESGAVAWIFQRKGIFYLSADGVTEEQLIENTLDIGGEEYQKIENQWMVQTKQDTFDAVRKKLEEMSVTIDMASVEWVPSNEVGLSHQDEAVFQSLNEALEDLDDVQKVISNVSG